MELVSRLESNSDEEPRPEALVTMRSVPPGERVDLAPAIRWHYLKGTRGLFGDTLGFVERLLRGDLYLIEVERVPAAAVLFDVWEGFADVHVVRWGELDRELFVEAVRKIGERAFTIHSLGTIRAELPVSNMGARRLAEDCGMVLLGRIERGVRLPNSGGFSDTVLYTLTPDGLGETVDG